MQCLWQVEIDDYAQRVLVRHWPEVKRYGDIREFSAWAIGENNGLCYNKVCELNDSKKQAYETLSEQSKLRRIGELLVSARIARGKCPFLQALLQEAGDFAPGIADTSICAESMAQMPMAGIGCAEKETQIGEVAPDTTVKKTTAGAKLENGAGECSPATSTHAKAAETLLQAKTSCRHTTLGIGQPRQTKDLMSLMESLYAKHATWNCTRNSATVDVICGGVPCQPASYAGKRRGTDDDRWLWPETFRVVREFHPTWCVFENVPGLLSLEQGAVFDTLLSTLEDQAYTCETFVIPAVAFDAPHRRERVFIVAHTNDTRLAEREGIRSNTQSQRTTIERGCGERRNETMADTHRQERLGRGYRGPTQRRMGRVVDGIPTLLDRPQFWLPEPNIPRVCKGQPDRVARLRALGNAVVPQVAEFIGRQIVTVEEMMENNSEN